MITKSREQLAAAVDLVGTPLYVYDVDVIRARFAQLKDLFGRQFGVSYAVKANPNIELLRVLLPHVTTFDVSSYREVERALEAGCPAERITFSGPAKRVVEVVGAVEQRIGELVLESLAEADTASAAAVERGVTQPVLIRINPSVGPRHFGVNMAGKASQFGIDEEEMEAAIDHVVALPNLELVGFHIYSGTNSLNAEAIAENFAIFIELFRRGAARAKLAPKKLVFGSGFGVPYTSSEKPLDVDDVAARVIPMIDAFKADPVFAQAECVLEMGRWLVSPAGLLLTSVIAEKTSRGVELRACDAGFNNHLAAFGMMGTVIRRNWNIANITNPDGPEGTYTLVGPLCTTIDILATDITLPQVRNGDILAVANSGAYGLTASPTRFISHPEPAEVLLDGERVVNVTESALNHWRTVASPGRVAAAATDA